ncbi:MAG: rare lipoprotein [Solirubrobacteraceae bacterium]|jgi:rare lipoprotein A (peptidoglycan hydrolase)|nr:rare lipoprotein [Solirubrobacteraceae bacterium]
MTLAAMLLGVTLGGGCGASGRVAGEATQRSSRAAAPPPAAPLGASTAKSPPTADPSSETATSGGSKAPSAIPPAHPVPAAFQPAAGAPSDAEVRSELAQLDTLQRRERQQQLSAAAANLAGLLPWSIEPKSGLRASVASVFRDYGLGLACGGVLGRDQLGVAHKTAPCGTLITFTYAGRSLTVPVIDRGPYIVGREWDLTGATATALAFPGLGQIQWSVAG